jgi:hypothetical protein
MTPNEAKKVCTKCKEEKPISQFSIRRGYVRKEHGTNSHCKACVAKTWKIYYLKNRNKLIEKACINGKSEKSKKRQKIYRNNNQEKIKILRMSWRKKNSKYVKEYYQKTKEHKLQYGKKYRDTHRDNVAVWVKNRHIKEKIINDPIKKLHQNISIGVRNALMKGQKQSPTFKLLGYTVDELKEHLEKQFVDNMSWDNYGINGWHIDHKIPKKAFNFEFPTDIDFKKCWELENLQPLWANKNRQKQDKLYFPFQPSLALTIG